MPLARVALYQKGITIYISANTNDNPEWFSTIQHIAIEGKCFFINADMLIRKSSSPPDLLENDTVQAISEDIDCRGGSCIVDPFGHYVTQPVWDKGEIIYADLDMNLPAVCKMEHDAVGHDSRPDILSSSSTKNNKNRPVQRATVLLHRAASAASDAGSLCVGRPESMKSQGPPPCLAWRGVFSRRMSVKKH